MRRPGPGPAVAITVALALALAAGCGGGGQPQSPAASRPDSTPSITGHELVRLDRINQGPGTHDIVTIGDDGSATIVKAYGGGGYVAYACRLDAAELASVTRAVDRLPLHGRIVHTKPELKGMYMPRPTWTIRAGHVVQSFAAVARPADATPLMGHLERLTSSREGRCRERYRQYR